MFCGTCGAQTADDQSFCWKCGAELKKADEGGTAQSVDALRAEAEELDDRFEELQRRHDEDVSALKSAFEEEAAKLAARRVAVADELARVERGETTDSAPASPSAESPAEAEQTSRSLDEAEEPEEPATACPAASPAPSPSYRADLQAAVPSPASRPAPRPAAPDVMATLPSVSYAPAPASTTAPMEPVDGGMQRLIEQERARERALRKDEARQEGQTGGRHAAPQAPVAPLPTTVQRSYIDAASRREDEKRLKRLHRRGDREEAPGARKARERRERRACGPFGKVRRKLPTKSYPGTLVLRDDFTAQCMLGYELLREDGTFKLEDGQYSRVVEFDDASFQASRREEQEAVFEQLVALYNSFDETVHLQIKIVCRVVSVEDFRADNFMPMQDGDERGNRVRRELNGIIEARVAETRQNVARRRLAVVRVEEQTLEEAAPRLARATDELVRMLRNIGAPARVLSGNELLGVIDSVTNPSDLRSTAPSFDDLKVSNGRGKSALQLGYTTLDLVAPPSIEKVDDAHLAWGGVVGQSLYVQKWASSVRTDMLAALAELPINQVITLDVQCWEQARALETIESMVTDLKVQKTDYVLKHSQTMYITDEMLPMSLADAIENTSELRDDLVSRDQKMWALHLTTLTWADDIAGCDANAESIKEVFRRFSYRAAPLTSLQRQGWAAAMPTGRCDVPDAYARNLTTAPLAALVPFTSVELNERGGMYMGQNSVSKNFIFYDRKNATSPNGFILGKPGRGKSVTAKSTIMWTLLTDPTAEVVVLDPEREYVNIARELGGDVVCISGESDTHVNPFDLEFGAAGGESPLTMKVDAIISMVEMMAKDLSEEQVSIIDRVTSAIYDKYLKTRDPADVPTLADFHAELAAQPQEEGKTLASILTRYVTGNASLFNCRTNVDVNNRFLVYDIRDCVASLKSLALLVLLDATWQRIVRNRERGVRTWVFVDEMQLLFENDFAVDYFDQMWSRSRKYGAVPTGITQNIERVIQNDKTRMMLANSDFLVLLGQSASDAAAVGEVVKLSDQQIGILRNAQPGEGLIVASGKIVPFVNVIPKDTHIYRMVTTKIDDLNEYRAEESGEST